MIISGHAVVIGEDVDTDMIIAGRYLRTIDKSVWVDHIFEDYDPCLAGKMNGAVLVAGKNFGCGSSREQAVVALKEAGVRAVIAQSFARIFFRNSINYGLYIIEADFFCEDGVPVVYNSETAEITTENISCKAAPLSTRMQEILLAGGLAEYLSTKVQDDDEDCNC
ncbi:2,3-dimethylmalate dehydratase small subunit [Methanocorpusculaceae archaeon Sp1]|nr:2,3-dimethylmalate dehydratase small subunit [Methanocorpusculaceae archaeon Sp1]